MHRRLLFLGLTVAGLAVVLIGVPLGIIASVLVHGAAQVAAVWGLVVGASLVAVGAAVVIARAQAWSLDRAFDDLVAEAGRLAGGDVRPVRRRYGVSELDEIADALDRTAARIASLRAAERRLVADASHQLRSPLAALSMRLEEIIATAARPSVREEAATALAQAQRLTAMVGGLLDMARPLPEGGGSAIDVDAVIEQQRAEWAPAFRRLDRKLRVEGRSRLPAVGDPSALAQVLSILIENAVMHGRGTVTLRTKEAEGYAVVEVADEGPGVDEDIAPRVFSRSFSGGAGTGLGLSLARDLVEAGGGRLELVEAAPHAVFAVFLAQHAGG
jgi:signal transduction histidine kinase